MQQKVCFGRPNYPLSQGRCQGAGPFQFLSSSYPAPGTNAGQSRSQGAGPLQMFAPNPTPDLLAWGWTNQGKGPTFISMQVPCRQSESHFTNQGLRRACVQKTVFFCFDRVVPLCRTSELRRHQRLKIFIKNQCITNFIFNETRGS